MMDAEVISDARRPAHLMRQTVSGRSSGKAREMDNDKLPEGYMRQEHRQVYPSQFHLAYAARRLIREFYAATHPTYQVPEDDTLVEVVDKAGGNLGLVLPFEKARPLDIADIQSQRLFEIVPPGQGERSWGNNKVDWIRDVVNQAMLGVPPFELGTNYEGEVGVRFAEGAPAWSLTWQTVDPGVISYHWHVLNAEDASEEAHGKAYLDNRWHDPTPFEMVRFAHALHEAVERLVQAREALGQIRAAETMPILPGTTSFDYIRSLVWWSDHDEGIARLLPVMRKPPVVELRKPPVVAQASPRRNAHIIGQTVGGGGGDGPEGYTTSGRHGNQPYNFHMGNSAHKVIASHYRFMHPKPKDVLINTVSMSNIVDQAGGKSALLLPDEKLLRPDITDLPQRIVFEIKPHGPDNLAAGQTTVTRYIAAMNRAIPSTKKPFFHGMGYDGEVWVKFADGAKVWRLSWKTTAPGVTQYQWHRQAVKREDEAKLEALMQADREGRWVDLTEKNRLIEAYDQAFRQDRWAELTDDDMQPYAARLEQAADIIVADRDAILQTQGVVNVPIEMTGIAASSVLGAELSRLMSATPKPAQRTTPGSVPLVPTPAPGPAPLRLVPTPAPAPGIRVPAPPPPVTKPPPRKAAKLQHRHPSI